jgi:hypothetical protein
MNNILKEKKFYLLWLTSILGALCVLPYTESLTGMTMTSGLLIGAIVQAAILYGFIVFFGLKLSEQQGFHLMPQRSFIVPSIASGIGVGVFIKLFDWLYFTVNKNVFLEQIPHVALWKRMLASVYGAVNEEILLRLFAVSFVVWLLQRISRLEKSYSVVISITFCALLFGIGHLPMLYKITENPNSWDLARVITLNGFAGIVFGLLYWRYGLLSSILSHFIADLVIHLF